jgi:urease alpha subunit
MGPTMGDRIIRLATRADRGNREGFQHYGDEITLGGGKVIRYGLGQSSGSLRKCRMARWIWRLIRTR